jgi:hypothetical protein
MIALMLLLFAGVYFVTEHNVPNGDPAAQLNRELVKLSPRYGWTVADDRAFTLDVRTPAIVWKVPARPHAVRFEVAASEDVQLWTDNTVAGRGLKFTLSADARKPISVTIADTREPDALTLAAVIVSNSARDRAFAPNRVHVVMYDWSCIANCSPITPD